MMSKPESLRTMGFSKVTPPQRKLPPSEKIARPEMKGLYQPSNHCPEKSSPIMWPAIIFSQKPWQPGVVNSPTKPRSRRQKLPKDSLSKLQHLKIGLNAPKRTRKSYSNRPFSGAMSVSGRVLGCPWYLVNGL